MTDSPGALTPSRLAERIGVTISAVSNWRTRHEDFPDPLVVDGQEAFAETALIQWLNRRVIPRNRLRPEEAYGTSYGDRLSRAGEPPSPSTPVPVVNPEPPGPLSNELWTVFDTLRGRHDPATISGLVVGLLYVRAEHPDTWRAVVATHDWEEKSALLRGVRVPPLPDGDVVPAFHALDSTPDSSIAEAIDKLDRVDFGAEASIVTQLSSAVFEIAGRQLGGSGGHFTPSAIAELLVDLLDPTMSSEVYDPFCGSGELLAAAHQHTVQNLLPATLFGCPPSASAKALSLMNLALHQAEADICSPGYAIVRDGFPDRRFDYIVTNPPFGLKLDLAEQDWAFGTPPGGRADLGWLQYAVSKLKPRGRGAVLLPMGAGFRSGREAAIRAAMVGAGVIDCVIALPPALFAETSIPTAIWIVRAMDASRAAPAAMLMIDAHDSGAARRGTRRLSAELHDRIIQEYKRWTGEPDMTAFRGESGFSRSVALAEVAAADFDLSPRRYVGVVEGRPTIEQSISTMFSVYERFEKLGDRLGDDNLAISRAVHAARENSRLARVGKYVQLGSIADILAGPGSVNRDQAESTATPLVLPRNIRDSVIGSANLDTVAPAVAEKLRRFSLRGGDIVTARAGTLGRFGQVSETQNGWILGPGCVRIRPHRIGDSGDSVDAEYLISYLNSAPIREWISANSMGSAIPHISASRLREMPIWLPSLRAQRGFAEQLERLRVAAGTYQQMSDLVITLREELAATLIPLDEESDERGRER